MNRLSEFRGEEERICLIRAGRNHEPRPTNQTTGPAAASPTHLAEHPPATLNPPHRLCEGLEKCRSGKEPPLHASPGEQNRQYIFFLLLPDPHHGARNRKPHLPGRASACHSPLARSPTRRLPASVRTAKRAHRIAPTSPFILKEESHFADIRRSGSSSHQLRHRVQGSTHSTCKPHNPVAASQPPAATPPPPPF